MRSSSTCTTVRAWRSRASRDRKSTRLNSSHSQISYAVFCLKKKKEAMLLLVHERTRVRRERGGERHVKSGGRRYSRDCSGVHNGMVTGERRVGRLRVKVWE